MFKFVLTNAGGNLSEAYNSIYEDTPRPQPETQPERSSTWPWKSFSDVEQWQLFLALSVFLATFDQITDILLLVEWFTHGHATWAFISLFFVLLNTAVRVVVFARQGEPVTAALAIFQLDVAHQAYLHVFVRQRKPQKHSSITVIRLFETSLEACPQTYLQSYVLFHKGAFEASPLLALSLAGSALAFAWGLADDKFDQPVDDAVGQDFQTLGYRVALLGHALSQIALRIVAIGTFSAAFGYWIIVPSLLIYLPVATLYVLYGEGETEGLGAALIIGFVTTLAPIAFDFASHGVLVTVLRLPYVDFVQLGMFSMALSVPTAWLADQDPAVVTAAAAVGVASFVLSLVSMGPYLRALFGWKTLDDAQKIWMHPSTWQRRRFVHAQEGSDEGTELIRWFRRAFRGFDLSPSAAPAEEAPRPGAWQWLA